jgi:hypothetical protein
MLWHSIYNLEDISLLVCVKLWVELKKKTWKKCLGLKELFNIVIIFDLVDQFKKKTWKKCLGLKELFDIVIILDLVDQF